MIAPGPRILILGGTRSGKSRYALERARDIGGDDVTYVATARPGDPGLDARIAAHRAERPPAWRTTDAGTDLAASLVSAPGADRPGAALLVDSVTLWVGELAERERPVAAVWDGLIAGLGLVRAAVIFVSDEVGLGVVPATPLGRSFRDDLGWLNQRIAACSDEVVLLVAGLPLHLKVPG